MSERLFSKVTLFGITFFKKDIFPTSSHIAPNPSAHLNFELTGKTHWENMGGGGESVWTVLSRGYSVSKVRGYGISKIKELQCQ